MTGIHATYVNLCAANNFSVAGNPKYKSCMYRKQSILDSIPNVHINKAPDKTKPEEVLSTKLKDHMLSGALSAEELKQELKVPSEGCQNLAQRQCNIFCLEIYRDILYELPPLLKTFCKQAIQGTGTVKTAIRDEPIDQNTWY